MKIEYPVYITPDKGQTLYELAEQISEAKKKGKIGGIVFVILPSKTVIQVEGTTTEEVRDSIATNCCGVTRF